MYWFPRNPSLVVEIYGCLVDFKFKSDSQNRVAAEFSAFVRDWESSQQARNHPSPPERKWVVFAICMYKCIACYYYISPLAA